MAWYNSPSDPSDGQRARASQLNAVDAAADAAFALLPTEDHMKKGTINYIADIGAANAYVVTMAYPPSSYTDGLVVCFKAANANTTASTINVNALGAKSIRTFDGTALVGGEIPAASFIEIRYDGVNGYFRFVGALNDRSGAALAAAAAAQATANAALPKAGGTMTGPITLAYPAGYALPFQGAFGMNFGSAYTQLAGATYVQVPILGNPNWETCALQFVHEPSVYAAARFQVGTSTVQIFDLRNNGIGYAPGGWQTTSDRRVKTDVTMIADPLDKIAQIRGVTFSRLDLAEMDGSPIVRAGLIAQEVEAVLPEAVSRVGDVRAELQNGDTSKMRSLDPLGVIGLLVECVKEIAERVEALEEAA